MTDVSLAEPAAAPVPPPAPRTWPTWLEILMCSGYPTQLVIGLVLRLAGLTPLMANGALSGTFVFALALTDTVVLVALIIFFLVRRGEHPAAVFFGGRPVRAEVVAGAASLPLVLAVVIGLTVGIRRYVPALHNVPDNPLVGLVAPGASIWIFLAVVVVAGGLREELQRAFLLHRFRGDLGQPWLGLFITSLAFGMGHTLQGNDAAIITGVLGAIWGAFYLTRGSAVASIVSHSLFNSGELLQALVR